MIEQLLKRTQSYLPLEITESSWDGIYLHMHGDNWNFNSMCVWRVSDNNKIVFSCYEEASEDNVKDLIGLEIVTLGVQTMAVKLDPVFFLSNGLKIEIFSTDTYEPWTFFHDSIGFFSATLDQI